jgi:leader peptidase (prepilin peptidase)/N-methyltransferase
VDAGIAAMILAAVAGGRDLLTIVFLTGLLVVLVAVSVVDLRERRIPNRLTYPTLLACLGLAIAGAPAAPALVGAAAFSATLLLPHLLRPDAMGLGDVKLALILGFAIGWVATGWSEAVVAVGWTVALSSVVGLVGAAIWRRRSIPFAPALSIGSTITIVATLI